MSSELQGLQWIAVGIFLGFGLLVMGCGASQSQATGPEGDVLDPARLYPLQEGNAWSYEITLPGGERSLKVMRVSSREGSKVEVATGSDVLLYELKPQGIYLPARAGWRLRKPLKKGAQWDSGGGKTANVKAVEQTVRTPAGEFKRCVVVEETGGALKRSIVTTYCPDVGPVLLDQVIRGMTQEPVDIRAQLLGYALAE